MVRALDVAAQNLEQHQQGLANVSERAPGSPTRQARPAPESRRMTSHYVVHAIPLHTWNNCLYVGRVFARREANCSSRLSRSIPPARHLVAHSSPDGAKTVAAF